ncbi:unnamed protein product [Dovyalis caffra]|uniref:PATROL1-like C-terminal domain-containing protein n=1 Tax=Dovyalis caffra TaxID=77055 RepID=A0AAV1SLU6_9ROSI|nr:unnamed protein product [Dovyalis caffra]
MAVALTSLLLRCDGLILFRKPSLSLLNKQICSTRITFAFASPKPKPKVAANLQSVIAMFVIVLRHVRAGTILSQLIAMLLIKLANQDGYAPSAVEILRIIDETLDGLLPDLMAGSRNTYVPTMPALARCTTESRFAWKKKEKSPNTQKRNSQIATMNGDNPFMVARVCVRINTLHRIRSELDVREKRIITHLGNLAFYQ